MRKKSLFRLMFWGSYRMPVLKIMVMIILTLSALLVGITAALQFPEIQTRVTHHFTKYLSKKLGLPVEVGFVNIYWLNQIYLEDLLVRDTQNDTLIYVANARLNYNFRNFISNKGITFNRAVIEHADVRVIRNAPDGRFNINIFDDAMKKQFGSDKPDSLKNTFLIKEIELYNSRFTLSDPAKDTIINKFNYNQFSIQDLNASGLNLTSKGKDFQIQFISLSGIDSATQLNIKNISGFYQITPGSMVFRTFDMDVGRSKIEASYVFQFDSIQQMKNFNEEVTIIADIKSSNLFTKDLGQFATIFKDYNHYYQLNGFFSGTVNRFNIDNFNLAMGSLSQLKGSVSMAGLPDIENTFIDLKIVNSFLNPEDLSQYAGERTINSLSKFGRSSFNGRYIGFPGDFVADAEFHTQIGYINSDINLKLDQDDNLPHYSGNLQVEGLDLGIILGDEERYQEIDLKGKIEGKGFYKSDADFLLDATVENFMILGYNYQNLLIDGRLASEIFHGLLSIDDPNLDFEMNGEIDLREGQERINVVAKIDTANLQNLNIAKKPTSLSTQINVDLRGLRLNTISGMIRAPYTQLMFDDHYASINNFKLISENTDSLNYLEISSDDLDAHISGNFLIDHLVRDIPEIVNEHLMLLRNDSAQINQYYHQKISSDTSEYFIDFNLSLFNINPLVQLFIPDLQIANNTYISGDLLIGPESRISVNSNIDTIQFKAYTFYNNDFSFNSKKWADTTLIDAAINIRSEKQENNNNTTTSDLALTGNWKNEKIDLDFNIDQMDKGNEIYIQNSIHLLPGSTVVKVDSSKIILLHDRWNFSPDNMIEIKGKEIIFSDVHLSHEEQFIELKGEISADTSKLLNLNIHNFSITTLNPVLPREFHGILNGFISMKRYYENPIIISNLDIDDLIFERFPSGDVHASSRWDPNDQKIGVNFEVFNEQKLKVIDINGGYYPDRSSEQRLDLSATFNNADINFIEPFYKDLISDLEGKTLGTFSISGNIRQPVVNGQARVSDGKIRINYLNTIYDFEGNVMFTENKLSVRDLVLNDKFKNKGVLNGGIIHNYFRNVRFDLRGQFEKLLVLNTSFSDNVLYYGTAFGTGNLHITGQEKNINFQIDAVTENGTKFYIPLSGNETEVIQENYIRFAKIGEGEEDDESTRSNVMKLKGIKLDFDLEVTPDAYCEIIFDLKAGDIIRGRGNGILSLLVDTNGDFNMFGDYEIQEGGYNFTLYNVINKEFSIEPNSRISWSGDPYEARLDLVATYRQLAALSPLFAADSSAYNNPEARRKYPANVVLHLTGPLMTPEIDFDIEINDYPKHLVINGVSFETAVSAFKSEIHSNEQELKRQVFSLIILRKFAEQGSFSVGNSFGNSVSEFISNQLSYWITQIDENLEIDLDLGTLDQNAFNTFQYRLSYSFSDGRFRVTRSGNISNEDDPNDLSNIIGDWTLEYLLSEDGKYRVKMYNRFNYNSLYGDSRSTTTATAGFSFMHTQSFNDFRDLLKSERERRKKEVNYIEFDEGVLPSNDKKEKADDSTTSRE